MKLSHPDWLDRSPWLGLWKAIRRLKGQKLHFQSKYADGWLSLSPPPPPPLSLPLNGIKADSMHARRRSIGRILERPAE